MDKLTDDLADLRHVLANPEKFSREEFLRARRTLQVLDGAIPLREKVRALGEQAKKILQERGIEVPSGVKVRPKSRRVKGGAPKNTTPPPGSKLVSKRGGARYYFTPKRDDEGDDK